MAFSEKLRSLFQDFSAESVAIFRGVLIDLDKNVTGETLQSIDSRIRFGNNKVTISYFAIDTFTKRIEGRKKGTPPPIEPIEVWVEKRGLDISPYAIQKSIGLFGTSTPPAPFFERLEEKLNPKLEQFLESDQVALVLFKRLDNLFNNRKR